MKKTPSPHNPDQVAHDLLDARDASPSRRVAAIAAAVHVGVAARVIADMAAVPVSVVEAVANDLRR